MLLHGFVKIDTWNALGCFHGFVKVATWIRLSCYMALSKHFSPLSDQNQAEV